MKTKREMGIRRMIDTFFYVEIEEFLNQRGRKKYSQTSAAGLHKYDSKIIDEIQSHIKESVERDMSKSRPLYDEIIKYIKRLDKSRYIRKNGEVKEAAFYQEAHIDKSTWSEIKWGQISPSKKTLLKLILALDLTHEEAEALLEKGKERFDPNDIQDQIIEAIVIVRKKYDLEVQDIVDILFEYQDMYSKTRPFDCIYETPEMIAERKGRKK